MRHYGEYRRPIPLFDAYEDWREARMLEEGNHSAQSRYDFPTFLWGPIRTSMIEGYEEVKGSYRRYMRVESPRDFRENRLRGLTPMTRPGRIGDHGDYPQLLRGERQRGGILLDTYGGTYGLTRRTIIDDDSNELLNSAPRAMGESASSFIVETAVAFIESNPTYSEDGLPVWHASRNNVDTALLSEESIVTATSRMTKQKDEDNRRITIQPRVLVVGDPKTELIARRIKTSTETGVRTAAESATDKFDKGTANVVGGLIPDVVYDPWFQDANDWILFADLRRSAAFVIGFLNGNEEPQVFLKNPEVRSVLGGGGQDPYTFEFDTIEWKVRFDFGVAVGDPRGTYRSMPA
jgi:hypothetical protein